MWRSRIFPSAQVAKISVDNFLLNAYHLRMKSEELWKT